MFNEHLQKTETSSKSSHLTHWSFPWSRFFLNKCLKLLIISGKQLLSKWLSTLYQKLHGSFYYGNDFFYWCTHPSYSDISLRPHAYIYLITHTQKCSAASQVCFILCHAQTPDVLPQALSDSPHHWSPQPGLPHSTLLGIIHYLPLALPFTLLLFVSLVLLLPLPASFISVLQVNTNTTQRFPRFDCANRWGKETTVDTAHLSF